MNNQQIDKIINFYRINHKFHPPYQLILDGNFVKLLVEKDLSFAHKVQTITNARVKLKTTPCILRELELLGHEFKLVLQAARRYKLIPCKHPLQYTADLCIFDQIGQANEHSYMVCSQDLQLRRNLRRNENVPIFYFGPDQRVTMEDINIFTLRRLEQEMQNKFLPTEIERKEVIEDKKQQAIIDKKKRIRDLSSQHGIQIKTKIVKGPNPLSVKRKREGNRREGQEDGSGAKQKRIRKRKNKKNANSM